MDTHTLIIGGGLSGLAIAHQLSREGQDWILLDSRDRLGGRILDAARDPDAGFDSLGYDMGPAWIWPHQRRIHALAEQLGVDLVPQYADGTLVFQDQDGAVRRDLTFAPMAGTERVAGGLTRLIDALARPLDPSRLLRAHRAETVTKTRTGLRIKTSGDRGFDAAQVVLAIPPRLAAARMDLSEILDEDARRAMSAIPTWMANSGKIMARYDAPFWRNQGLSGDAISHRGPMMELHDATPYGGTGGALFGFLHPQIVAMNPPQDALLTAVRTQLGALFGPEAADPIAMSAKLWLSDGDTAVPADADSAGHPPGGLPKALKAAEADGLFFAGAEVARDDPGLLEGALAAAEACAARLSETTILPA